MYVPLCLPSGMLNQADENAVPIMVLLNGITFTYTPLVYNHAKRYEKEHA